MSLKKLPSSHARVSLTLFQLVTVPVLEFVDEDNLIVRTEESSAWYRLSNSQATQLVKAKVYV